MATGNFRELEHRLALLTQARDGVGATKLFKRFVLPENLRTEFYSYLHERVTRKETFQALGYGGLAILVYSVAFCFLLQRPPPGWFIGLAILMPVAWLATSGVVRNRLLPRQGLLGLSSGQSWMVLEVLAVVGTLLAGWMIRVETSGSLPEALTRAVIYLVLLAFIGGVRKPRRIAMGAVGAGLLCFQLADAPMVVVLRLVPPSSGHQPRECARRGRCRLAGMGSWGVCTVRRAFRHNWRELQAPEDAPVVLAATRAP